MTESVISSININRNRKGWNVLDCPSNTFIKRLAEFFKEKNIIKLPKVQIILIL
jgi:small subunit ribosomal protein S19e